MELDLLTTGIKLIDMFGGNIPVIPDVLNAVGGLLNNNHEAVTGAVATGVVIKTTADLIGIYKKTWKGFCRDKGIKRAKWLIALAKKLTKAEIRILGKKLPITVLQKIGELILTGIDSYCTGIAETIK